MEKQLNSSGQCSQIFVIGYSSRDPKKDLARKNIQPEEFKDRIIFMSMFNDIDWSKRKNDENCILNAEKVKNYAMKFSQGHWTFLGPGSEEKWYGSSSYAQKGEWDSLANKMVQQFKETGHPVFKSISALSRGILKKKGRDTINFNGDSPNTELLFHTIHSVNQLSIYGAVTNWCQQFGLTEEEKGRANLSVDKKMLTSIPPEELQLLVSPPTMAPGNRMRENILNFETLSSRIHLTQQMCKSLLPTSCDSQEEV